MDRDDFFTVDTSDDPEWDWPMIFAALKESVPTCRRSNFKAARRQAIAWRVSVRHGDQRSFAKWRQEMVPPPKKFATGQE
jgi:hypothetical protein